MELIDFPHRNLDRKHSNLAKRVVERNFIVAVIRSKRLLLNYYSFSRDLLVATDLPSVDPMLFLWHDSGKNV